MPHLRSTSTSILNLNPTLRILLLVYDGTIKFCFFKKKLYFISTIIFWLIFLVFKNPVNSVASSTVW